MKTMLVNVTKLVALSVACQLQSCPFPVVWGNSQFGTCDVSYVTMAHIVPDLQQFETMHIITCVLCFF